MQNTFKFEILYQSKKSKARIGRIHTPHGIIDTPNFVAVGTHATLKAIDAHMADQMGLQLMFCNTYHLMLQPGAQTVAAAGGLHTFMNRKGPLITDSGGFQVFSLAYGTVKDELKSRGQKKEGNSVLKIDEEGVVFRSYRDGQKIVLTPEESIRAQKLLGADIMVAFDELPPYHTDPKALRTSLDRTHRWQERSMQTHQNHLSNQAMYAVVHGGIDPDLRKLSCAFLSQLPFDGFGIGGSLGKNHEEMFGMLSYTTSYLPPEAPLHLLGIGDLTSIGKCITYGIDTFDSSHPTRCARHGLLFTSTGMVKILNSAHKLSFEPIDKNCSCYVCQHYTRAYIHHLFKAQELTAFSLASIHNVHFMITLMKQYQQAILHGEI